jgi:hypothetical protein
VRPREEPDRLLDLPLRRLFDGRDVVADDRERDRAGLEVAGEPVGERLPHVDRHDPTRRERRAHRPRPLGLDSDHARARATGRPQPEP